jgi:hypothetical protein
VQYISKYCHTSNEMTSSCTCITKTNFFWGRESLAKGTNINIYCEKVRSELCYQVLSGLHTLKLFCRNLTVRISPMLGVCSCTLWHCHTVLTLRQCDTVLTLRHCHTVLTLRHCADTTTLPNCADTATMPHCADTTTLPHCADTTTLPHCADTATLCWHYDNATLCWHCHTVLTLRHCQTVLTLRHCHTVLTLRHCADNATMCRHWDTVLILRHCQTVLTLRDTQSVYGTWRTEAPGCTSASYGTVTEDIRLERETDRLLQNYKCSEPCLHRQRHTTAAYTETLLVCFSYSLYNKCYRWGGSTLMFQFRINCSVEKTPGPSSWIFRCFEIHQTCKANKQTLA